MSISRDEANMDIGRLGINQMHICYHGGTTLILRRYSSAEKPNILNVDVDNIIAALSICDVVFPAGTLMLSILLP